MNIVPVLLSIVAPDADVIVITPFGLISTLFVVADALIFPPSTLNFVAGDVVPIPTFPLLVAKFAPAADCIVDEKNAPPVLIKVNASGVVLLPIINCVVFNLVPNDHV